MNRNTVLKWTVIIVVFILIQFLHWFWFRVIHVVASFAWWGMVFFLAFILLPVFNKMNPSTQHQVVGLVIPRVFRTASILGFFSIGMGWRSAFEMAHWDFSHFFSSGEDIILLFGGLLGTCLYIFHIFLERKEINIALRISTLSSLDLKDPKVNDLLKKIKIIPRVGFVIISLAALTMFLH